MYVVPLFQLVIDKQKALVRFGMMHIMATNLCVLLVTVIAETAEDYRQEDFIKRNISTLASKVLIFPKSVGSVQLWI